MEKTKRLLATDSKQLRLRYGDKPITFLNVYEPSIRFPKKIRELFALIWFEKHRRLIIAGPRGGGKSFLLGAIGFCKWFFQGRNIVDMGGSLAQAEIVYNYFSAICYSDPAILDSLPKEPLQHNSESDIKSYFKCVAASPKQVRGPHPDTLFADEACETDGDLLMAALPMVGTSPHSMVVITSTFHKVFGLYQEIWDNADELGYVRFKWDIIDVVKSFDPKIWDDPELNSQVGDLQELRKLVAGRTGDPEGWIPIENIIQEWRQKPTLDWFLVEYMGSRPSVAGLVIDPMQVQEAVFDDSNKQLVQEYAYIAGAEVIGGLDWGFSGMTALVGAMRHANGVLVQKHLKTYTKVELSKIIEDTIQFVLKYRVTRIYADSAGKFENKELQNALNTDPRLTEAKIKCVVVEVVFSKHKEFMLGNYRAYFEQRKYKIPASHKLAIWQHKRYRYAEGTDKPVKQDDHIPDATMCLLQHWPLNRKAEHISAKNTLDQKGGIAGGLRDMRF